MRISRRQFLRGGLLLSAGFAVSPAVSQAAADSGSVATQAAAPWNAGARMVETPGVSISGSGPDRFSARPSLDHTTVPKYAAGLIVPPPMPKHPVTPEIIDKDGTPVDYYEIAVRQFKQQVLPAPFPQTTVWSYGPGTNALDDLSNFNFPAFTIEAQVGRPVRVRWKNELYKNINVQTAGGVVTQKSFLSHIVPVDQTLHWAYPQGGLLGSDTRPNWTGQETPGPYNGPVPMVVHVHGAHTTEDSDGYAEAWWLPDTPDIPPGFARHGAQHDRFKAIFEARHAVAGQEGVWQWKPGEAVSQYPNDQRAGTIWYHDHTLGMTRNNVYAGPAGFYLLRGGPDGEPLGGGLLPAGAYEIPLAIQDRTFNDDGSLFYPDARTYFDGLDGPFIPRSDISPIWNPEFFGLGMLVNGRTWPRLEVEARRYRFRILNGCNARTLILRLASAPNPVIPNPPPAGPPFDPPLPRSNAGTLPFWVIGTEGGFLPGNAVKVESDINQPGAGLLMMPAERFDVIVDFSGLAPGTTVLMINDGPDEPFGGGMPGKDFPYANPATTGQVMQFVIKAPSGPDPSTGPALLQFPGITHFAGQPPARVRKLSLNEMESEQILVPNPAPGFPALVPAGPVEALLGTMREASPGVWTPVPLEWVAEVSEDITLGEIEEWELFNYTMDAHPIHVHEVMFQVVGRQPFEMMTGQPVGTARPPEPYETGWKDTVIAYPGEVTRIRLKFDYPGLFVWHCHIVEHEDNEMMRPLTVSYRQYMPLVGKSP